MLFFNKNSKNKSKEETWKVPSFPQNLYVLSCKRIILKKRARGGGRVQVILLNHSKFPQYQIKEQKLPGGTSLAAFNASGTAAIYYSVIW